jgi:glucokinase
VGHIRLAPAGPEGYGKPGSFEGFCSGGGIARQARARARELLDQGRPAPFCPSVEKLESLTARELFDAARSGDPVAREIVSSCARRLGEGLAILVDILNPERIVIGGIFARAQELLLPAAQAVIDAEALEISRKACSIVPAGLGEQIGDYAALSVAAHGCRGG